MPTQYGRLLKNPPQVRDPVLLAGLKDRAPDAEAAFLRLCNDSRPLEEQIPSPPAGTSYQDCDPRLLAQLWVRANLDNALQALAHGAGFPGPSSPSYPDLDGSLLWLLWNLAHDGDALRQLLQHRDRRAEIELLRLYNQNRGQASSRVAEPARGASYRRYPRVLLALLWPLAGNLEALHALADQLHLIVPDPPSYDQMGDDLLGQLWKLGRDGAALEALWQRQSLLPIAEVGADTPERVLGYLCWSEQRADARSELLRRYKLLDAGTEEFLRRFKRRRVPWPYESADDLAQDVAVKLLQQVETWDYATYPTLENRLFRSVRNLIIDRIRQRARRPLVGRLEEIEAVPDGREPAPAAAVVLDVLPAVGQRVILKAKFGIELTADEIHWSAARNLETRGETALDQERIDEERERIGDWLLAHPSPAGQHLAECFVWHNPCKFDRVLRDWRLRRGADETRRLLAQLLPREPEPDRLAVQVEEAMAALVTRATGGRRRARSGPGNVALFGGMQEMAGRLWHRLGRFPLDHRQAEAFGAARQEFGWFCEHFPILLKLAGCWRLMRRLIDRAPPAAVRLLGKLAGWLEAGTWLATFPERDRRRGLALAEELTAQRNLCPDRLHGDLDLLLLWLRSTQRPGPPEQRLADLDRAWWLAADSPLAGDLVGAAAREDWPGVGQAAGEILQTSPAPGRVIWSARHERDDCLRRLHSGQTAALVKLAACRRLLGCLREQAPPEAVAWLDQLASFLKEGRGAPALEHLSRLLQSNGPLQGSALAALQLLGLWLRTLPEADVPGQAVQDVDRVWSLSHEPDYGGPAELPGRADALVAAAWQGKWFDVARAARKLLSRCPDGPSGWPARHEFRTCLRRLADRRERRRSPL